MRKKRSEYSPEEQEALREKDRLYQRERRKRMIEGLSDEERKEYFKDLYKERKLKKRIKWLNNSLAKYH